MRHLTEQIDIGRVAGGDRRVAASLRLAAIAAGLWLVAACLPGPVTASAQGEKESFKEYDVKAVFLFHFAQFVEWPDASFPESGSPLVIGVLGPDPFGPILDKAVQGERIRDRPLEVRRFTKPQDVSGCHLLYICPGDKRRIDEALSRLHGQAVLTVSDHPAFTEAGGIVGMRTAKGRVRFSINVRSAEEAGLKISAKLLSVAQSSEKEP